MLEGVLICRWSFIDKVRSLIEALKLLLENFSHTISKGKYINTLIVIEMFPGTF